MSTSKRFHVRARGPWACFTRPELKGERVSYEVMTPSAARGVLEAVLWKPAIRWQIHSIKVLAPIRWNAVRRNEVGDKMSLRGEAYYVEERRQQRNTVALRDVDYLITASFCMTDLAGPSDTLIKFEEMMARRLEKGQMYHQAYLGTREFAADVLPGDPDLPAVEVGVDRPLGLMFYDFDYRQEGPSPLFFDARLQGGVLNVPSYEQVLANTAGGRA